MAVTGGGVVRQRLVDRALVDQMVLSSDAFQIYLAFSLAFGGAVAACGCALIGGVLHPIPFYIATAVLGTATILMGLVAFVESKKRRSVRLGLDGATTELAFNLEIGIPQSTPSTSGFTVTTVT